MEENIYYIQVNNQTITFVSTVLIIDRDQMLVGQIIRFLIMGNQEGSVAFSKLVFKHLAKEGPMGEKLGIISALSVLIRVEPLRSVGLVEFHSFFSSCLHLNQSLCRFTLSRHFRFLFSGVGLASSLICTSKLLSR